MHSVSWPNGALPIKWNKVENGNVAMAEAKEKKSTPVHHPFSAQGWKR